MIKQYSFVLFMIITNTVYSQKQIKYEYYGGHGCVDLELELYTDSTYLFTRSEAVMIPLTFKRKGAYLMYDDAIHLYQYKRLHFLIPFATKKYREYVFRKDENNIYLYDEEDLTDKNRNFIMDYNTLHLYKPQKNG